MEMERHEFRGEDAPDKLRQMFGPGQVDQHMSQAIQTCWMMMPKDKQTVDEVEKQMRRIFERALKNLREDGEAFAMP